MTVATAVFGLYFGLLCCLWATGGVSAFNLEANFPIIKLGRYDSYFGYSVAQHRTLRDPQHGQDVLLVGAPRDDNLQPNTTRSGALWQCPLSTDLQVKLFLVHVKQLRLLLLLLNLVRVSPIDFNLIHNS